MQTNVWAGRTNCAPRERELAAVLQIVAQRVRVSLFQHSTEFSVTAKVWREVIAILSSQCANKRIATLPSNFAVRISTPTV